MKYPRTQTIILTLLCTGLTPILLVAMAVQALFGSTKRAHLMAVALDECGNALFGGSPEMTISERTGNALLDKKPWAVPASKFIDFFFGKDHCLKNATVNRNKD